MKKNVLVSIIAGITAFAGVCVAIFAFFKRKSKKIYQDLDFEDDIFIDEFGNDDDYAYIQDNNTDIDDEQSDCQNSNENNN